METSEQAQKPQNKTVYVSYIILNAYSYYSCELQKAKIVTIPRKIKVNVIHESENKLCIYSYSHMLATNQKRLFRRAITHLKNQLSWIECQYKDLEQQQKDANT